MAGVGGLNGWQWIFILEGIVTVLVGATLPWTLADSPETASFLTPEEKALIKHRLEEDSGTAAGKVGINEGFQWKYLKGALTDWKIYLAVIIYWGNSIALYGFTYSAPTIIAGLGYTSANAQLLTVPVYALGVISTIFFSVLADRHQTKWLFIIIPYSIALVGFIGLLSVPHPKLPGLTYAFLYCIPAGVYPPLICCLSWIGNNLAPSWKRAVGMALLISIGNLGGAVGSNVYLQQQSPHYWLGYGMGAGMVAAAIVSTLILKVAFERINQRRDQMDISDIRAKYTDEELIELGNDSPLFRFVV